MLLIEHQTIVSLYWSFTELYHDYTKACTFYFQLTITVTRASVEFN